MGFKQRERKRKAKAAQQGSQLAARESGSSAGKWWLTLVVEDCCCAQCGRVLRVGREMVYRHTPREARCTRCAERDPECRWRPSLSWERAGRGKRKAAEIPRERVEGQGARAGRHRGRQGPRPDEELTVHDVHPPLAPRPKIRPGY